MTKRVTGLVWCASLAGVLVVSTLCQAATGKHSEVTTSRLVKLAAAQFPNLTKAERAMLWFSDIDNIDRGEIAVAGPSSNPADPSNDPAHADQWGPQRDIRATLIRWMCVNPDTTKLVDPKGILVLGARVTGSLDLSNVRVPFAIAFHKCSIPELIDFDAVQLPALNLDGTYAGEISADGIQVMGPLSLADGFRASAEVYMTGAKVDGDAVFVGGHFKHSKVESHAGWGPLNAALMLDHAQFRKSVMICCGFDADGGVLIYGSSIGGDLYAMGGRFSNPNNVALTANEADIGGDIELGAPPDNRTGFLGGKFESDGMVQFNSARVKGPVLVADADLHGARESRHGFEATGLSTSGLFWMDVKLENDASLNLNGAQVSVLLDEEKSWPQPGKLFIDGLKYDLLGNPAEAAGSISKIDVSGVSGRLRWIGLNANRDDPQPYSELARFYRTSGNDFAANQVLIAREDARYANYGLGGQVLGSFLKAAIGYGHRPLRAIIWMLVVVTIGWVMVFVGVRAGVMRPTWPENVPHSSQPDYEDLHPLLYSLDVFLPFVNLHQEHYWWPNSNASGAYSIMGRSISVSGSVLRYYLWLQIIAGWLLSAIFIAGVTGLIRND